VQKPELTMTVVVCTPTIEEIPIIRTLFREYADSLGLNLCFQNFEQELADLPGKYAPPTGCLLLAKIDDEPAGCVALRFFDETSCEMKRLYVRNRYRGAGVGKVLVERVIQEARAIGYRRMLLDTMPSLMGTAVSLYERFGFEKIEPYCDNPYLDAVYMALRL
jgi:GNAT superfamily N-acetyltransferase